MKLKGKVQALIGASVLSWLYGSLIFGLLGRLAPIWMERFQVGKGAIGLLMTIALLAMGVTMYYAGKLADEKGTKLSLTIGVLLTAAALLGMAYVQNLYTLYACGIILGVSGSLEFGTGLACVQRWWPEKSGLVSGIFNLCFGASAAVMVPIYHYLLQSQGYYHALISITLLVVVIGLIFAQLTASPDETTAGAKPGQIMPSSPDGEEPSFFTVKEALQTSTFWLIWAIWALSGTAGIGLVMLALPLSQDIGLTLAQGSLLLVTFNAVNGLIRMVVGPLADKIGGKAIMAPIFTVGAIACFLLTRAESFGAAAIYLALIGGTLGTVFTVTPVLVRQYFGLKNFGAIFGLIFTSYCFFSALAGPFLGGVVRDLTGNFTATAIYFGVFLAISVALVVKLTPPQQPVTVNSDSLDSSI